MKRLLSLFLVLALGLGILPVYSAAYDGDRYHISTAKELYALCESDALKDAMLYLLGDVTISEVLIVPRGVELVQCTGTLSIKAPLIISVGAGLRVLSGAKAVLDDSASLHNDGILQLSGTLTVDGLYTGEGKLQGAGKLAGKKGASLKLAASKGAELVFAGPASALNPNGYDSITVTAGAGGHIWYSLDGEDKLLTLGASPKAGSAYAFERWVLSDPSGKTLVASELMNKALFSDEESPILWLYASDIAAYCAQQGLSGLRFTARFTSGTVDTPARVLRFEPGKAKGGKSAAEGVMDDISLDAGSYRPTKIPECAFTREGLAFTRWNTKADGTGQDYEPGEYIYLWTDTTLYAQWKAQG